MPAQVAEGVGEDQEGPEDRADTLPDPDSDPQDLGVNTDHLEDSDSIEPRDNPEKHLEEGDSEPESLDEADNLLSGTGSEAATHGERGEHISTPGV